MRETEGRMPGLVYKASQVKQEEMEENMSFADGEIDKVWLTPESELKSEQKE